MAIIPLKQTITIKKAAESMDRFNRPVYSDPVSMKCRISEGTKLIRSRSQGMTTNAEVVSSAQIYLDKLVDISMDDEITFTDELGNVRTWKPLNVDIKRGLNGKAILTVVYV
jgi:hypothetical protein